LLERALHVVGGVDVDVRIRLHLRLCVGHGPGLRLWLLGDASRDHDLAPLVDLYHDRSHARHLRQDRPGMDKFGSVVNRMYTMLGKRFLKSMRIKTQLSKRPQRVIVVDGATHSQKDGAEGNGGSLKDGAEAFMLFLRDAQLVLRLSVLTVLDFNEVNVTLNAMLKPNVAFKSKRCIEEC